MPNINTQKIVSIQKKWRPSIAQIIAIIVALLLILPLVGLFAARLTSHQFVRETESNLLAQATLFSQVFALEFLSTSPQFKIGHRLNNDQINQQTLQFMPLRPRLRAHQTQTLPPRPNAEQVKGPIKFPYSLIAGKLTKLAKRSQKGTLATYQALDASGRVIAGTSEQNGSLFHIAEIKAALKGETITLLRTRSDNHRKHLLSSLSRDTNYRVFVAMPVIVNHQVVGAVYLSRTPLNLSKFLYQERQTITIVASFVLITAGIIGFLFWRLISGPIKAIKQQSSHIAAGEEHAPEKLVRYGTKELADLGQSILSMSKTLSKRRETLQTYTSHVTHELKSPVTSILGAIELLETRHDQMSKAQRTKFLNNIRGDGERMAELLNRLRELAKADLQQSPSQCTLASVAEKLKATHPDLQIKLTAPEEQKLPFSEETALIIFSHLAQNAAQHKASEVHICYSAHDHTLKVSDNGQGMSPGNCDKVLDAFFTTRRTNGGTGLGLTIVKKLLESHNTTITPLKAPTPSKTGAQFLIELPEYERHHLALKL